MTDQWFYTLEQDLHAADVAKQRTRMREIIDTGYAALCRQYAGCEPTLRELEAAYAQLRQLVEDWNGEEAG